MQVQSLGQEDPLEKEMSIHSSILAWETPWTEEHWAAVRGVAELDMTEHTDLSWCFRGHTAWDSASPSESGLQTWKLANVQQLGKRLCLLTEDPQPPQHPCLNSSHCINCQYPFLMPMYLERSSAVNGPDTPATQVAATPFCLLIMTVPPGEVELSTHLKSCYSHCSQGA